MIKGRLVIVSAPSGAGKGTLLARVRERMPELTVCISATTRAPRLGEKDGVDYYFLSRDAFLDHVNSGNFAEWAEVHGQYYGTLKDELQRRLDLGGTVVFELDVQGMRSMKTMYPEAVSVFISPPDLETLEKRLKLRGTNDSADMAVRLRNARKEMEARSIFDYVVVNDDLETATQAFETILREATASCQK